MKVNTEIIEAMTPCGNRFNNWLQHYSNFDGPIEQFLDLPNIIHSDKIWVIVRLLPEFKREVFAIDCAIRAAACASASAYADADADTAAADAAAAASYAAAYAVNAAYAAAAYAVSAAASYAANAIIAVQQEQQAQIESLIYLIQTMEVS